MITKKSDYMVMDWSEESLPDKFFMGKYDHHDWSCFPGTGMCSRMQKAKYALTQNGHINRHSEQVRHNFEELKELMQYPGGRPMTPA